MKPKGKISVEEAVKRIYPGLPQRFSMISLHAMVAREINRPYVFMDTVRRKLMVLREEGVISFKNIDKARSIYHKTDAL
jgi:Fe2+ or Zn2+ uptake regulation protein